MKLVISGVNNAGLFARGVGRGEAAKRKAWLDESRRKEAELLRIAFGETPVEKPPAHLRELWCHRVFTLGEPSLLSEISEGVYDPEDADNDIDNDFS